jgi:hypothetical protein
MNAKLAISLMAFAVALLPRCAEALESFVKRGPADPTGEIRIVNSSGAVRISAWDRPEFAIEAAAGPGVQRIDATTDKGVNSFRVVLKDGVSGSQDALVKINIPSGSHVDVETVSASVWIGGINGPVTVRSLSGSVSATQSAAAAASVQTLTGAISLRSGARSVDVRTTTGRVDLTLADPETVRVRSVSGFVGIEARLGRSTRVDAETTGAALRAHFSGEAGYRYDIATHGGALHSCFDHRAGGERGAVAEKRLIGRVGAGGASVQLRTFGGALELCGW